MKEAYLIDSPLGKNSRFDSLYDPQLLFAVPRNTQREKINIYEKLPFSGVDIWNAYEISWLNPKGKPQVAIGIFYVPCHSKYITESKSLKLYLNSFYQSTFESVKDVQKIVQEDLSKVTESSVDVHLVEPSNYNQEISLGFMPGLCLDALDIETSTYSVTPQLLKTHPTVVEEELYSDLLKSNCLGTKQPDLASLYVHYKGDQIDHASLLKYIISFRTHNEFGEHCIERIFTDLMCYCKPEKLTVYGRYTRRGGIDLNPFRSNFEKSLKNRRDFRQ